MRNTPDVSLRPIPDAAFLQEDDVEICEAPLDEEGAAIVGIPEHAVHGRSLLRSLTREDLTAWRYFFSGHLKSEASDTRSASPSPSA